MKELSILEKKIVQNLRNIMYDRKITQAAMATFTGTSASQFSKILNGQVSLSLSQLSKLATSLSMREIDIITYPDVYVKREQADASQEPVEDVLLQFKLRKEKKDQVLKLVFGENNIEILNK